MKNIQTHFLCFLLLGLFSFPFIFPADANAQIGGITSGKLKDNPNDDRKLCRPSNEWANNNKFCDYYAGYESNFGTNNVKAAEYRNLMIDFLKVQIDDYYNNHKNGRVTNTKWFQTILDILGIGLALSGTISNGERVKTVLGAVTGSFLAGRNSVNDRFHLLQQQILINTMNSNRIDQWSEIIKKKKLDINEFSWDNAKDDLQQYLFRGSFTDALDSLVEQTGAKVQASQNNYNVVLKAVSQTTLDDKLRNFKEYIVPMNAMAKKLDADILANNALIPVPLPAVLTPAIIAAKAEKVVLDAKRTSLLDNYNKIFLAIKVGGDFTTIDTKLKAKYNGAPPVLVVMTPYNNVFNNLTANPSLITFSDYDEALTSINEFAGADAEMNKRFLAILQLYKI